MLHKKEDGVEWLEFELLANEKKLTHRIFLKHGGYSKDEYESLNLSFQVGDKHHHVSANVDKVTNLLNLKKIVRGNLCHGNRVVSVDENTLSPNGEFDAMTTQSSNIGLLITHADCQATILYDPITHAVANIHCGWRGNVANIYLAAVNKMREAYGSRPENLLAGISPSLGPKHAEFVNYQTELPEEFWKHRVSPNHFDLWAIARKQLSDCGLLPHHIECANLCTYSDPDNYFSYRREQKSGRHGTVVFLK